MTQRADKRLGRLRKDKEERLDEIGFVWLVRIGEKENTEKWDLKWEGKYKELIQFYEENGHYRVPQISKNKTIMALGTWVMNQKAWYRRGQLTEDRKERLNMRGFPWKSVGIRETKWQSHFQKLKGFLENLKASGEEGNLYGPSVLGTSLYSWVIAQRRANKVGRIDPNRKDLLDGIGFVWSPET